MYEGFGIPLLEAMHCGCPIASDIPQHENTGRLLYIFFTSKLDELIDAFEKVITEGRDLARLRKALKENQTFIGIEQQEKP